MLSSRPNHGETITPGARAFQPRAFIVRRHYLLVRISHWLNIPLLLGLILSGISIYWASPIYQHSPNPTTGSFDYLADAGIWICAHTPWLDHYADPANWIYNHGSLGPYMLDFALRFHWLCAYLFMLNGLVYLAGLCIGGGWRSLLPRLSEARGALQMTRYYLSLPYVILARRQPIHPSFDKVSRLLYSQHHLVPIYTKSQITPLKNNYNGATPDPAYIPGLRLNLDGLSSGLAVSLDIEALLARHQIHDQITRLVCVEGWSAIAWWSGLRFDDFLHAYPPVSQAKWALLESAVNLDANGNPDPYFVSIDLLTAQHPQTLLATHLNGRPLPVEHGAPLRLLAPMKLGLKNIKAITRISYTKDEPPDYWAKRGYSRYDGI